MKSFNNTKQIILHISGNKLKINEFERTVENYKTEINDVKKEKLKAFKIQDKIEKAEESKTLKKLVGLMTLFTVVINAFSLYLRSTSPPVINISVLQIFYEIIVYSIHITALLILFSLIMLFIIYICKYGILIIRRF